MRLAARGLRDLDHRTELIHTGVERDAVRAQARHVTRKSVAAAVLATSVYLLLTS